MGGFGIWDLATAVPERLAAIAPLCGGGDASLAHRLSKLPVWAFHGELDETVLVVATRDMVNAAEAAGSSPQLTLYAHQGHDICDSTYQTPELYA
jgi:predicted peptidase